MFGFTHYQLFAVAMLWFNGLCFGSIGVNWYWMWRFKRLRREVDQIRRDMNNAAMMWAGIHSDATSDVWDA